MEKLEWCMWLPNDAYILKICLFVSTECTNVTDTRTDGQRMTAKAALAYCTVSQGNKIQQIKSVVRYLFFTLGLTMHQKTGITPWRCPRRRDTILMQLSGCSLLLQNFNTYFTTQRVCIAQTMLSQDVCPSVTCRSCNEMITHIIKLFFTTW